MIPVTPRDLKDTILNPEHGGEFLKCWICGGESSANKGDYFMHRDDYVFTCCGVNMELCIKKVEFISVER